MVSQRKGRGARGSVRFPEQTLVLKTFPREGKAEWVNIVSNIIN